MREYLIKLVCEGTAKAETCNLHLECASAKGDCGFCTIMADYLIANGVIVFPCKIGDIVYFIYETCDEDGKEYKTIDTGIVHGFSKDKTGTWVFCRYESGLSYHHKAEDFGETLFFARENAEKALIEG